VLGIETSALVCHFKKVSLNFSVDLRSICSLVNRYLANMNFFRQYISPLIIFLVFLVALVAVSARIFLPADMAAPAPIESGISLAFNKILV
jgi:hypothetical protein